MVADPHRLDPLRVLGVEVVLVGVEDPGAGPDPAAPPHPELTFGREVAAVQQGVGSDLDPGPREGDDVDGTDRRAPPMHARRMREALERAGHEVDWLFDHDQGHAFIGDEVNEGLYRRVLAFLADNTGS